MKELFCVGKRSIHIRGQFIRVIKGGGRMYKTVIVNYSPVAKEMAANIENIANQMEQEGFVLVSCAVMPSAKGILIFRQTKSPQSD